MIIESINWFENEFFGSESINGLIKITFLINYIMIFITLGILVMIIFNLITYTSKFFVYKKEEESIYLEEKKKLSIPRKAIKISKIILATSLFLLNWEIFERFFGFIGIFYASLNITVIYLNYSVIIC